MKEISIEEKAKKYDETLERAKIWQKHLNESGDNDYAKELSYVFPELKESEDKRIKKEIIKFVHFFYDASLNFKHTVSEEDMVAWLKKQGEQPQSKSALEAIKEEKVDNQNCVEPDDKPKFKAKDWYVSEIDGKIHNMYNSVYKPKFKVGDWITNGRYNFLIVGVDSRHYQFKNGDAKYIDDIDKKYHLWTIEDAKDGDILVCDGNHGKEIGIVKKYIGKYGGCDICFVTYCFVDWDGIFRVGEYMGTRNIHPATKEQRDILFQKMKETGCEFDFEKKELKKIK